MSISTKSFFVYLAVALVILSVLTPDVECRRNVLRGRKTVTRRYLRPMAIPAWAVIVLVGLGQLIVGALLYVLMKKLIVDPPVQGNYSMAATDDV
ncbi:hypothetical protein HUJ04_003622 [Dendroctonus ponderosae]|uniref:Uncharacterized protein n=1 Tax=Dendroctonus ponderosae TaxID=77166 RepID=A0AAR5PIM4_DENPD|nr:hypothetical protein HUJ04_003622 [Dendroctonus ponderosae]KAH1010301.1 hypothetical protein HUJ05_004617 [Dendroctonus ponderosae]